MTDIVNFVPLTAKVEIRGQKISVRGLEFDEIGQLVYRFPKFREIKSLSLPEIMKLMDREIQAAVIAAATGHPGDEKAERSFANLSLGERAQLFSKIFEITSPGGIGPFVDLMQTLKPPQDLVSGAEGAGGKIVVRSRRSSGQRAS